MINLVNTNHFTQRSIQTLIFNLWQCNALTSNYLGRVKSNKCLLKSFWYFLDWQMKNHFWLPFIFKYPNVCNSLVYKLYFDCSIFWQWYWSTLVLHRNLPAFAQAGSDFTLWGIQNLSNDVRHQHYCSLDAAIVFPNSVYGLCPFKQ